MRFLLCLPLLISGVGFAQDAQHVPPAGSESPAAPLPPPPLVPAPEQPEEFPPQGESIPYEYRAGSQRSASTKRLLLELLAGTGTGAAAGIAGLFTGGLLVGFDCGSSDCIIPVVGSMAIGVMLGTPLGVYGAGRIMDGRGGFLPSLAGTAAGTALGLILGVVFVSLENDALAVTSLIAGPLTGAIVGYELSHAAQRPEPLSATSSSISSGLHFVPMFSITRAGSLLGGLTGSF